MELEIEVEEEPGLRLEVLDDFSLSLSIGFGGRFVRLVGEGIEGGVLAPSIKEDADAKETLLSEVLLRTALAIGGSGCMYR